MEGKRGGEKPGVERGQGEGAEEGGGEVQTGPVRPGSPVLVWCSLMRPVCGSGTAAGMSTWRAAWSEPYPTIPPGSEPHLLKSLQAMGS